MLEPRRKSLNLSEKPVRALGKRSGERVQKLMLHMLKEEAREGRDAAKDDCDPE